MGMYVYAKPQAQSVAQVVPEIPRVMEDDQVQAPPANRGKGKGTGNGDPDGPVWAHPWPDPFPWPREPPPFPSWQDYQDQYLHLLWPFPLTVMNHTLTSLFEDHGGCPAAECFVRSQVVKDVNMNSLDLLYHPIPYILQLFSIYLDQAAVQTYGFKLTNLTWTCVEPKHTRHQHS